MENTMNKAYSFFLLILISLIFPHSVMAQSADIDVTIAFADGTVERSTIEGFSLGLEGEEPQAALLLPAVQAAREAARRSKANISKEELIPTILIESSTEESYYKWKLTNVMIKSYSIHGSSNTIPIETLKLSYERVEYSFNGVAKSYDCTSKICTLETNSYSRSDY
jgi:hypothetical protein